MIIDRAAFEALCHGILGASESPDGALAPVRFTQRQLGFYSRTESDRIRSLASAGACFACITDATRLILDYEVAPGSSQDIYGFDVYASNEMIFHKQAKISQEPSGTLEVALPAGRKPVRLYLPNLAITKLRRLELENAYALEAIKAKRWLMLGDSIIQGYTTGFASITLSNLLSLKLCINLINQGMAGEVFNADFLDGDLGFVPGRIIAAYGTNDWNLRSAAEFAKEAERFIGRLAEIWPGVPVTLISPIWRVDASEPKTPGFEFSRIHEVLSEISAHYPNISLISGLGLLPPVKELFYDRLVHPNELGFLLYAKRLMELTDRFKQ